MRLAADRVTKSVRQRCLRVQWWGLRVRHWGLAGTVILAVPAAMAQTASCERACLIGHADRYMEALTRHDPAVIPFARDARLAENQQAIEPGEGIWKSAVSFSKARQYVADAQTGQVGVQAIVDDSGKPAIFALRLKIVNNEITEAETLVTHDGEGGPPFEPEGFLTREAPYIREVPQQIRSSREVLLQTARRYWDIATKTHRGEDEPYTTDCFHFQNGVNTSWERELTAAEAAAPERNAPQAYDGRIWICARELTMTTQPWTRERSVRTLVDADRGLVMTWNLVDVKGRPGPDGKMQPPPKSGDPIPPLPANAPPGLSALGWSQRGQPQTFYHAEVKRIIGGKVQREQVFQRALPADAKSAF